MTVDQKQELVSAVSQVIRNDPGELGSSAKAAQVTEQFFRAAMHNPELSFSSLLWMALATFLIWGHSDSSRLGSDSCARRRDGEDSRWGVRVGRCTRNIGVHVHSLPAA